MFYVNNRNTHRNWIKTAFKFIPYVLNGRPILMELDHYDTVLDEIYAHKDPASLHDRGRMFVFLEDHAKLCCSVASADFEQEVDRLLAE